MQEVVEFDIDKKNLLRDVISKQTGSLNKAIKELFQNAFDAGATKISVVLTTKSLQFIDNGCGMNRDEIHKYFRVFGATAKRNDSEKTGAFGMGRGQVFNFGNVVWKTQKAMMSVDIRKSLEYTIKDSEDHIYGTDITITFYQELYSWNISNIIYRIKKDVLPPKDINVFLNGSLYKPGLKEFKDLSNSKYYVFTSTDHVSTIYNGGLAVKNIKDSNYKYSIMPYSKLELNFARNELIETSKSTEDLNFFIYKMEEVMASKKDRFNFSEALNILRLLSSMRISLSSVYNKKVIPLSNEKLISFRDLIDSPNMGVLFGKKNIWSDDCIRQDYRVISFDVKQKILRIKDNFGLKLEFLNKDTKELSRRGFHKEIELHDLKKNIHYYYMALELNEYIFSKIIVDDYDEYSSRAIGLGVSDIAAAWTDGSESIWINKNVIEGFTNKEEALIKLWEYLCHEYAHTSKNIKEDLHNYEFYENYEDIVKKSMTYLPQCMRYINRKLLKEKYEI